jgi:hypothetical protein
MYLEAADPGGEHFPDVLVRQWRRPASLDEYFCYTFLRRFSRLLSAINFAAMSLVHAAAPAELEHPSSSANLAAPVTWQLSSHCRI